MQPGLLAFAVIVVIGIIVWSVLKPAKKVADLHSLDHVKMTNVMNIVKENVDNDNVTDYAFRESIRHYLAVFEGKKYDISEPVRPEPDVTIPAEEDSSDTPVDVTIPDENKD